jgi:8-oxo-dGTP diphosphatase
MFKRFVVSIWRKAPAVVRRAGVRLVEPKFTVSAGAVVLDQQGRVLLLKHRFRPGAGWGVPGGFIAKAEQPEAALRRELIEEVGLNLRDVEFLCVRTIRKHVEIIYRCAPDGDAAVRSIEISRADWFALDQLPPMLSNSQRELIGRATGAGAVGTKDSI